MWAALAQKHAIAQFDAKKIKGFVRDSGALQRQFTDGIRRVFTPARRMDAGATTAAPPNLGEVGPATGADAVGSGRIIVHRATHLIIKRENVGSLDHPGTRRNGIGGQYRAGHVRCADLPGLPHDGI